MIPTRTTQPYRRGPRQQGAALSAMLAGKPMYLPNPADTQRQTAMMGRQKNPLAAMLGLPPSSAGPTVKRKNG